MVKVLYVPQIITYVGHIYKLSWKLKYLLLFGEYLVLHYRILALSGILLSIHAYPNMFTAVIYYQ